MASNMMMGPTEELNRMKKCVRCDSAKTALIKHKRKIDGGISVYERWHNDGNGQPLCNACYNLEWWHKNKSTGRKAGRPHKLINKKKPAEFKMPKDVKNMSIRSLIKSFPPSWKHKDLLDIFAVILDTFASNNNKVKRLSLSTLKLIVSTTHPMLMEKITAMIEHELLEVDTHPRTGLSLFTVTSKGSEFLRRYRRMAELIAWMQ